MTGRLRSGLGACTSVASLTLVTLVTLVGCDGDRGTAKSASGAAGAVTTASCDRGNPTAAYLAFREYIKTATPTPQRFLTAVGTDSAAPDDGFRAMQDKGPSYFYAGDSVAKKKLREKLAAVGPFASLLIVHRGTKTAATGDTVSVRLGGHYIGGMLDGKTAVSKAIVMVCVVDAWKVASTTDEPTP